MSGGQVLAHVRRVLTGHPDRALIHAVADAGLEIKIEVAAESVRDVTPDRGYVLMVSWSLLELPRAAEPAPAPATPAEPPPAAATPGRPLTPANAVDAEFMALMGPARRGRPEPPSAAAARGDSPAPASAVDAEFMRLMTRERPPTPEPAASPTAASGPAPEQQIAALLGLVPGRPT